MLGEYLDMEDITQYNRDTMSRLRIIPSRKYSQVAQCKDEVVEDLKKLAESDGIDPFALVVVNTDNCGFKEGGSDIDKVGYQQCTAIQTITFNTFDVKT